MSSVKTTTARARISPDIKSEAEGIIHDLGLSVSMAFELFYRQIIFNRGLPFELRIPNKATVKAIEDARKGRGEKFATSATAGTVTSRTTGRLPAERTGTHSDLFKK